MSLVIVNAPYSAPPMRSDARQRMITSAALLIRERGVEATSFSDVLEHSGAPRGSIYHHCPRGKAQLVEEATRHAGDFVAAGLAAALEQDDFAAAVDMFVDFWRSILRESDYTAGCPVVAATVEGERASGARDAAGAAFRRWEEMVGETLQRSGLEPGRARSVATLAVAAIEGAVVLARAQRSPAPLERVAAELQALARDAVPGPARS